MVIKPRVRGFICTTAHPVGCAANVDEQIAFIKEQQPIHGPKRVLVIGSSTGYGLASRIVAAFGANADTIGVFFERPSTSGRPASAGWYNAAAFEKRAKAAGYYAKSFNGDAFSDDLKAEVIETIKKDWGQVDLIIYSLAAPKRKDPETGEVYSSVLKPIGKTFSSKSVNFQTGKVTETTIEPATEEEIRQTIAVMGGDDWSRWIHALAEAKVLSKGAQTVAYSYIGPELTHDIYRTGTIGQAKDDLEQTTHRLSDFLQEEVGGQAYVSVNKALVTQSSAAIPVVPLYISLLYKVMKEKGLHENCIQQMYRLFADRLYGEVTSLDEEGRIRIDDWEMREDVQQEVKKRWAELNTENIEELSDIAGYRQEFLNLFGFEVPGVDYQADVDVEVPIASVEQK